MEKISATDAKNSFGSLIDDAQRHPIAIQKQKRNYAVVLSFCDYEDYEKYQKNKKKKQTLREFKKLFKETSQLAKVEGISQKDIDDETL